MKAHKKRKFKWRMLRNVSLILAVSMIFCSAVGFIYFQGVVREQKISDERSEMRQTASQLAFRLDDVRKFAQSILIDRELQEDLALEPFESEFQRQIVYDRVANRLIFYNNLRTYVRDSTLKMESGIWYGTSYVRYSEEMPGEELIEQHRIEGSPYSGAYEKGFQGPVICYQVQIRDKHQFGQRSGTLYLELELDYFLEPVRQYAEEYKSVCLLGKDGSVLFEQDAGGTLRAGLGDPAQWPEEPAARVSGGYLLCDRVEEGEWTLCTLIPDRYLWQRSEFVLEFFLLSFLVTLGLILIFISRTMENMIRPVTALSERMEKFEYGDMEPPDTIHTGDEIETLYECCGHMIREIRRGAEERVRHERQEKEMEFDIMLSQINPHYLYNVLNTVVYLAAAKGENDVVEIVRALLYSLQETLNIGEQSIEATIRQELELTRCYLKIQEYRYPGAYTVDIRCQAGLEDCVAPKAVIQPLVENAILHGILPGDGPGSIGVEIFTEDGQLRIVVEDDGVGIPAACMQRPEQSSAAAPEKGGRKHIGLSNVRDRIRFLYGDEYGVEIGRGAEKGTRILLRLPLIRRDAGGRDAEGTGGEDR